MRTLGRSSVALAQSSWSLLSSALGGRIESGLIYPISYSSWVSPAQVVPKKGGMNVVRNEKNDLISTRWSLDGGCAQTTTSSMMLREMITFLQHLWIRCQSSQRAKAYTIYRTIIQGTIRLQWTPKIKRRLLSHALLEFLLIEECRSAYVTHRPLFRGACWLSLLIWWKSALKYSWKTSLSLSLLFVGSSGLGIIKKGRLN